MFCANCGAEIPDRSRFCPSCGHPVSGVAHGSAAAPQANGYHAPGPVPPAAMPQAPKRKGHVGLVVGIVAACVVVLALIAFGMGRSADVDTSDESSPAATTHVDEEEDSSEDTNDFDDMGDGADAEGFAADSSGSYADADAPVEGENVTQLGDTIFYVSEDWTQILARPRAGGDESAVYTVDGNGTDKMVAEVATDGEHLYVAQVDRVGGTVDILQLDVDGSVQDDLLSADGLDDVISADLYVTKHRIGFVSLGYDPETMMIDNQHLYFADKDGSSAGDFALSDEAGARCMTDDAFWYVTSTDADLGYQDNLHRVDLDTGSDESVYRTTCSHRSSDLNAGNGCVYLVYNSGSEFRIFAIDENGLQGGLDLMAPEIDGAASDNFTAYTVCADRHSGHIIIAGDYVKTDGSCLGAVLVSNMDGSGLAKVLESPADPTGLGTSSIVMATPCGSGMAVDVNYGYSQQDYVVDADGQNLVLYHEWRSDTSSYSGGDQGSIENPDGELNT